MISSKLYQATKSREPNAPYLHKASECITGLHAGIKVHFCALRFGKTFRELALDYSAIFDSVGGCKYEGYKILEDNQRNRENRDDK